MTDAYPTVTSVDAPDMSGWSLALVVSDPAAPGTKRFNEVRELTVAEFGAYEDAIAAIYELHGHNLTGALVDALNALVAADAAIADLRPAQDRALETKLNSAIDSYLAAFTSFRSKVESLSDRFPSEHVYDDARDLFSSVHSSNPAFRLTWELRNASQHDSGVPGLSRYEDEHGARDLRVNAGALFAAHAGERRWDRCAALWPGATFIDLLPLFGEAYQECQRILGMFLINREVRINRAAEVIAKLFVEAEPRETNPIIFRAEDPVGDGRTLNIQTKPIDMLAVGFMIGTVDGARAILGLESVDLSVRPAP